MQPSQWEIIVLKPTSVFQSFLASQLPGVDVPDLRQLQTDNTAYVIRKQASDEATLDEIERHFSKMFRHEISRWLGDAARNEIEGSFLDFLCCFKFELHTHIVMMESAMEIGEQLVRIKPRAVLLKWMREVVEEDSELSTLLSKVNVNQLAENSTVIIKNFTQLDEIKPFVQQYYRPLFEAEMSRMSNSPDDWPLVESFQDFIRYFSIDIHTQLIHLH